jgi:hypothetical protein
MNDILFAGIARVELHALNENEKKAVLKKFPPGCGRLRDTPFDIFVGHIPDDQLNGEKLFIAAGPGKQDADAIIKERLADTRHSSYDHHGMAGTFQQDDGDRISVNTGTLDEGVRGKRYLFNKVGQFIDLQG